MNKGMIAALVAILVGAVAFMLTGEKPKKEAKKAEVTAPAPEKQIVIAVPSFLTGGAAGPFGIPAMNGAKMVVDAINKGSLPAPYNTKGFGGVSGAVIELDEGGGATKQVAEYRNLVEKRNVDAVVGYISSGNCQALAPIAEELKQFTIFATCGTPRIFEEAERKYVFRTMGHATADNVAAAMYVKKNSQIQRGIPASTKTMLGAKTHGVILI